jgi:hypothetical protein
VADTFIIQCIPRGPRSHVSCPPVQPAWASLVRRPGSRTGPVFWAQGCLLSPLSSNFQLPLFLSCFSCPSCLSSPLTTAHDPPWTYLKPRHVPVHPYPLPCHSLLVPSSTDSTGNPTRGWAAALVELDDCILRPRHCIALNDPFHRRVNTNNRARCKRTTMSVTYLRHATGRARRTSTFRTLHRRSTFKG